MINREFFEALELLEKEKGIPVPYMIEKIQNAVSIAVKRDANGGEDNIVEIDPVTARFFVAVRKHVVEQVEDLEEAHVLLDAGHRVLLEVALGARVLLAPDLQLDVHL